MKVKKPYVPFLKKIMDSEEKESKELETIRREDNQRFVRSAVQMIATNGYIMPMS